MPSSTTRSRSDSCSRGSVAAEAALTRRPAKPPPFADTAVAAAFGAYPPRLRTRLMQLRKLIFETAARTPGVGALRETLKWGQPAYLTAETKSGSTIRLDRTPGEGEGCAIYFHCQTSLVDEVRSLYPELRCEGNRAIVFDAEDDISADAVRHCIAMALTYHLRKKRPAERKR